MDKKNWREVRWYLMILKKALTLIVKFDNILSMQKYKKETKVPKETISVLGISKL